MLRRRSLRTFGDSERAMRNAESQRRQTIIVDDNDDDGDDDDDDDDDDDNEDNHDNNHNKNHNNNHNNNNDNNNDNNDDNYSNEDVNVSVGGAAQEGRTQDMAKKLVRFALACEYQRRPIRRIDVKEKVLDNNGRQFNVVWKLAQQHLRDVFGMQMAELPSKERITLQQRRAAQKATSQSKQVVSYVLVNILPDQFRDPRVLQPPAVPVSGDDSRYTGIYTLLVSLIYLSGGALSDSKMQRCLTRLQMEDRTPITDCERTEKLLKRLEREGYVAQIKENVGTDADDVYWVVGPRGKVEVGEKGVRGLTKSVFGDLSTEAEEAELDRKIERSLGLNERRETKTSDVPMRDSRNGRTRRDAEDSYTMRDDGNDGGYSSGSVE